MNHLYFFTASYPFDYRESFIETEIHFLSSSFEKVTIIPLYGDTNNKRRVPNNCIVLNPIIRNKFQHYIVGLFEFTSFRLFSKFFFDKKVYLSRRRLQIFLTTFCTINSLLQSKSLKKTLIKIDSDDYMYFYWGVGSSQLIPFLQKNKAKKVIRFHGEWDLWEESSGGAIPLREEVLKAIDLAVFISLKGKEYFHHRYRNLEPKSIVSYLGTKDYGYAERSSDGIIRLLSCSSLIPLKRVGLIIDSIQTIKNQKVEWTHIGDGPEMLELINKSNSLNPNIKVNIIGRLSNQEVINYYINNKIDVFINVSSIEGLPVTMMESISFNVPIIATDVGGVSELVNSETGILLKPNPNTEEIAEAIINIGLNNLNPKSFWNRKFNADINYPRFIEVIKTLS